MGGYAGIENLSCGKATREKINVENKFSTGVIF